MRPESEPTGPASAAPVRRWLERTDWLWAIVGGFYLVAYLYWYVPALARLPGSLRYPPEGFPWHWSLDFVATGVTGSVLLFLGFRRATELSNDRGDRQGRRRRRGRGNRAGGEELEDRRADEAGDESES